MDEYTPQTVNVSLAEVKELMREDVDALAGIVIPDVSEYAFPPILVSFWQALVESVMNIKTNRFPKISIGIPRGHAKSTLVKLYVLWCILFSRKQFILIVCAKESLASNIIADIVDMLDSQAVRDIFGDWRVNLETDKAELKKFEFCGRPIILAAAGSGSSFRGLNLKNARPDIMVFDDAQTKDCAESEAESRKFVSWFTSTAMKAKSPKHCTFIYIGNMYKELVLERDAKGNPLVYGCMLHNLSFNKDWKSYVSGAILADGSVLWEELHPKEELMRDLESDMSLGSGAEWFAEVQNDPTYIPKITLDTDAIKKRTKVDKEDNEESFARYLIIDPSLGKKKSDEIAIGLFEVFDETPVFSQLWTKRIPQPELVKFTIETALKYQVPLILSEDYGMQGTLIQWFNFWVQNLNIDGLEFLGINRGRMSKTSAIIDYFKTLNAGNQILDESVFTRVVDQGTKFDTRRTDNDDDILDVGYYGNRAWAYEEVRTAAEVPLLASFAYEENAEYNGVIVPTGSYTY